MEALATMTEAVAAELEIPSPALRNRQRGNMMSKSPTSRYMPRFRLTLIVCLVAAAALETRAIAREQLAKEIENVSKVIRQRFSTHPQAYRRRALLYLRAGHGDVLKASLDATRAIDLGAGPEAHVIRAEARLRLGNYQGAIDDAAQCVNSSRFPDGQRANAYYILSQAHFKLGNSTAAASGYSKAIKLAPDQHGVWLSPSDMPNVLKKADQARKTGKPLRAAELYTQAIVLDPNRPEGYVGRAQIYYEFGKVWRAEDDLDRAFQVSDDPGVDALAMRFEIKLRRNDSHPELLKELREQITSALDKNSQQPRIRLVRAKAIAKLAFRQVLKDRKKSLRSAVEDVNQYLRSHSDEYSAYYLRSELHYYLGDFDQANKDFNRVVAARPANLTLLFTPVERLGWDRCQIRRIAPVDKTVVPLSKDEAIVAQYRYALKGYMRYGDYKNAIVMANDAIDQFPNEKSLYDLKQFALHAQKTLPVE